MNNFIVKRQFPIYKFDNLKQVFDNEFMTVKKIPMFVNGVVVWTYYHIEIKPGKTTIRYNVDVDCRITILEGSAWFMLEYKKEPGSMMVEPGDMFIIPNGSEYMVLNQSQHQKMV